MSNPLLIFAGLLIAGGAVLAGLAVFTWRRRSAEWSLELTALLIAATVWVLGAAAEHLSPTLAGKVLATKVQYLGILTLPIASFATVLVATGRASWLRRLLPFWAAFVALGFTTVATNELHGWIWAKVALHSNPGFPLMAVQYGPAFWFVSLLGHSQLAIAAILYFPRPWRNWQADTTLVYIGLAAPWIANLIYMTRSGPWPYLDLTPLGLVVMGLSFTISFHIIGNVFSTVRLAHREVLDHIADMVLVFERSGRLLSANRAARRLLELPPLPALAAQALVKYAPLLAHPRGGEADTSRDISLEIDGELRTFDARSVPIASGRTSLPGTVVVLREVTVQRASENESRTHRRQLRQIIDIIPHPIYAKDANGRFLLANEACARLYGLRACDITGRAHAELHANAEEVARMLADDRRVIESQKPLTIEESANTKTGQPRIFRTIKSPLFRGDSEAPAVVGVSIDVTEEKERERLLESLASTDPLTSLANRRHFEMVLGRTIETARRKDRRAALLFIDLDRFKTVNDVYGHLTGDEVLRQVAARIEKSLRFSDRVVGPGTGRSGATTVSRIGGDEFIVLLPDVAAPGNAANVARRLLEAMEAPFGVRNDHFQLGASIGISVFPDDGTDAETLLRYGDQALTSVKRDGGGGFAFFSASISAVEERRHALEQGLRRALGRDEFSLHFQPIRETRSAAIVGAEALLRWTSAELGPVPPGEFIPVAEESGLVGPIGLLVVRSVCEQIASWRDRLFRLPRFSINLSARQLIDPDSSAQIEAILDETEISGSCVEFEITESSILSGNPIVEKTLSALRDLGATFALDDFGTGYSSLSHLQRFSFQRIKIDRSFVRGIGTIDRDEQLASAVIALAQRLGIQTVAEGVETEEQLDFLRAEGCDFVQGFLLGRPLPAAEFEKFLEIEK